jgi:predicted CopG family antitoxin
MQKPVSIQENLYNKLKDMKTGSLRSFTEIIQFLIDENKRLKEETEKLRGENIKLLEENTEKKRRGFW